MLWSAGTILSFFAPPGESPSPDENLSSDTSYSQKTQAPAIAIQIPEDLPSLSQFNINFSSPQNPPHDLAYFREQLLKAKQDIEQHNPTQAMDTLELLEEEFEEVVFPKLVLGETLKEEWQDLDGEIRELTDRTANLAVKANDAFLKEARIYYQRSQDFKARGDHEGQIAELLHLLSESRVAGWHEDQDILWSSPELRALFLRAQFDLARSYYQKDLITPNGVVSSRANGDEMVDGVLEQENYTEHEKAAFRILKILSQLSRSNLNQEKMDLIIGEIQSLQELPGLDSLWESLASILGGSLGLEQTSEQQKETLQKLLWDYHHSEVHERQFDGKGAGAIAILGAAVIAAGFLGWVGAAEAGGGSLLTTSSSGLTQWVAGLGTYFTFFQLNTFVPEFVSCFLIHSGVPIGKNSEEIHTEVPTQVELIAAAKDGLTSFKENGTIRSPYHEFVPQAEVRSEMDSEDYFSEYTEKLAYFQNQIAQAISFAQEAANQYKLIKAPGEDLTEKELFKQAHRQILGVRHKLRYLWKHYRGKHDKLIDFFPDSKCSEEELNPSLTQTIAEFVGIKLPTKACQGSNCVGQTLLLLSAMMESNISLPPGWQWGIQSFEDHMQLVIYNKTGDEVWDILRNKVHKERYAPIYQPPYLYYAYLHKLGEDPGIGLETLLIAEKNADMITEAEDREGENSIFDTPGSQGLFGGSLPDYALLDLETGEPINFSDLVWKSLTEFVQTLSETKKTSNRQNSSFIKPNLGELNPDLIASSQFDIWNLDDKIIVKFSQESHVSEYNGLSSKGEKAQFQFLFDLAEQSLKESFASTDFERVRKALENQDDFFAFIASPPEDLETLLTKLNVIQALGALEPAHYLLNELSIEENWENFSEYETRLLAISPGMQAYARTCQIFLAEVKKDPLAFVLRLDQMDPKSRETALMLMDKLPQGLLGFPDNSALDIIKEQVIENPNLVDIREGKFSSSFRIVTSFSIEDENPLLQDKAFSPPQFSATHREEESPLNEEQASVAKALYKIKPHTFFTILEYYNFSWRWDLGYGEEYAQYLKDKFDLQKEKRGSILDRLLDRGYTEAGEAWLKEQENQGLDPEELLRHLDRLANRYKEEHHYAKALQITERMASLAPSRYSIAVEHAEVLLEAGQVEEARQFLLSANQRYNSPNDSGRKVDAYLLLVQIDIRQGNYELAKTNLLSSLEYAEKAGYDYHKTKQLLYAITIGENLDNNKFVRDIYQKIIDLITDYDDKSTLEVIYQLFLEKRGNPLPKDEEDIATSLGKKDFSHMSFLANSLIENKKITTLKQILLKLQSLSNHEHQPITFYIAALVAKEEGRLEDAYKNFSRAVELADDFEKGNYLYELGSLLEFQERLEEAKHIYELQLQVENSTQGYNRDNSSWHISQIQEKINKAKYLRQTNSPEEK